MAGEKVRVTMTISRGETKGKLFELQQGTNLVGRWDPDAGAFPEVDLESHDPEAKISRRHALIHLEGNRLFIEDAGSLNGTFINRSARLEPEKRVEVVDGDEVIVGKTFLTVHFDRSPES